MKLRSSEEFNRYKQEVIDNINDGLSRNPVVLNRFRYEIMDLFSTYTIGYSLTHQPELVFVKEFNEKLITSLMALMSKPEVIGLDLDAMVEGINMSLEGLPFKAEVIDNQTFLYGEGLAYRFWSEDAAITNPVFIGITNDQ